MSVEVSIIMPTYNSAAYVEKSIAAVQSQNTSFETELIIVDDGSVDQTVTLVKKRQKQNAHLLLLQQSNQKQAAARNHGLEHASGKYIMFVDSDDLLLPGAVEKLHQALQLQGKKFAVGGIIKRFKDHDEVEDKSILEGAHDQKQMLACYLAQNQEMDVGLWGKMFIRDVLGAQKLENGNFFEDSLFVFDYLLKLKPNEIAYVQQPLYVLFKHDNTTTTSYDSTIDQRALDYLNKVKLRLQQYGTLDQRMFAAFVSRTILHVVHHHIKYDADWNSKQQRSLLNSKFSAEIRCTNRWLSRKYRMALFLAKYFPKFYIRMYRGEKLRRN